MQIILVDDHSILLDGLKNLLQEVPDYEVVACCTNGHYAICHLKTDAIDLMVADYSMPDMDGLLLIKEAKSIRPDLKIIVLTMHDEPHKVQEMMALGIDGYILKKYAQQELLTALSVVGNGGKFWSNEVSNILVRGLGLKAEELILTDREVEVLKLIMQEKSSKEIAAELFISERTVETHRKNMIRKTNSSSTVGLIKYAYEHDLV
ncbi:response regulator [Pedobacter alpinus]|uniref:Response regulator n=1 Tax=Pedobacter alpinus TaxID=1590643 RepID=A0ABW5TUQ3_9SPHI